MVSVLSPAFLLKRNRQNSKHSQTIACEGKTLPSQIKNESQEVTNTSLEEAECLKRAIEARRKKGQSNFAKCANLEEKKERNF